MLDDEHGVACVNQPLQNLNQLVDICHVKAGRRLVENIECAAGCTAGEFRCKLNALRLAAGERCGALPEFNIAKAYVNECGNLIADARQIVKEGQRFLRRHIEYVRNILALVQNFQRLAVIALSMADLAGDENVGQKVHLNLHKTVAAAGLAAAALCVE